MLTGIVEPNVELGARAEAKARCCGFALLLVHDDLIPCRAPSIGIRRAVSVVRGVADRLAFARSRSVGGAGGVGGFNKRSVGRTFLAWVVPNRIEEVAHL